ncbi:DNA primase/helicase protein [Rhizobium phage RHph_Y3_56_1]|nr:DNA primase/helicase protein [Rhizobium phage RHph_Y3_1]QIG77971.1 DNA primase/helicase protein [Rhizobium phage RHph_Y3_56_1]
MNAAKSKSDPVYLNPKDIAAALGGIARGNQVSAPAPGHSRRDRSLRILIDPAAPEGFAVHAHAGEDPIEMRDYVRSKAQLPDWRPDIDQPQAPTAHVRLVRKPEPPKPFSDHHLVSRGFHHSVTYDYTSTDGEVVFEVLRYEHPVETKTFVQRRPDGKGGWLSGRGDPILYRLHELAANASDPVFVTEGEKDADRLASLGYLATTVPNGSWPDDLSALTGRTVYVLADNDPAGDKKASTAIERLAGIATTYRIDLPDLPAKGDVSDWLDAGHSAEELEDACQAAAPVPANDNTPAVKMVSIFEWTVDRFVGEAPAVEYLVDGVIPLGIPGMVSAAGDTGKSFALLELHRRVAFGSGLYAPPIFGGKVLGEGASVMITSEDDANEVHRRISALDAKGERFGSAGKRMIVVPLPSAGGARVFWKEDRKHGLIETDDFKRICDQLKTVEGLRLVTFDPLASFAHLPLNEDPTAGQFVCSSLARLATETGATVLTAHHMRKSKAPIESLADAREAIRGSTALVDGLRLAYAMWPADEARAKRTCKSLGIEYQPNRIVLGGVVKANGAARRILSTYARSDSGLLIDKTSGLGATAPAQDDLRAALVIAVEAAAAAGAPFTKTGASGLFEMRERLPDELRRIAKGRLDALASEALERGDIVRAAARGEKTAKWLDVPGGLFAIGLGNFTSGAPR